LIALPAAMPMIPNLVGSDDKRSDILVGEGERSITTSGDCGDNYFIEGCEDIAVSGTVTKWQAYVRLISNLTYACRPVGVRLI